MATHNGYVSGGRLLHKGDITWADKTAWSDYTKWIEYTDTTIETETGAKGQPLRWQSDVMDLGLIKVVYPEVRVQTDGTPKKEPSLKNELEFPTKQLELLINFK